MALCVAVLIASEVMPVSLLWPIATDPVVSEERAGQAVPISGPFAVITSPSVAQMTARIDCNPVQSGVTALLIPSVVIVALAPRHPVPMIGRAPPGEAIGGFWSMSTAIAMRLLPPAQVPQGLPALARALDMEKPMRLRCRLADQDVTHAQIDTASTREPVSRPPMARTIEDVLTCEKPAICRAGWTRASWPISTMGRQEISATVATGELHPLPRRLHLSRRPGPAWRDRRAAGLPSRCAAPTPCTLS